MDIWSLLHGVPVGMAQSLRVGTSEGLSPHIPVVAVGSGAVG